jgi:hypothetical protein
LVLVIRLRLYGVITSKKVMMKLNTRTVRREALNVLDRLSLGKLPVETEEM